MTRLGKHPLDWLGANWYWDYEGDRDFKGRHAVNIQTGATLSVREAQQVQHGQQDLQQAVLKRYGSQGDVLREGVTSDYLIVKFNSLAGAILYASKSERPTYIVEYGRVRVPYPNEVGGLGYRSLMPGRRDFTYYQRETNINQIYAKSSQEFSQSSRNVFYVWESIAR